MYYFNKMAKLASVAVFNTHLCRKWFKKPNDFKQANETLAEKSYNCMCSPDAIKNALNVFKNMDTFKK